MIFKGKGRQRLKNLYMAGLHKELGQDIEGHRRPSSAGVLHVFVEMVQIIAAGIVQQGTAIIKNRRRPQPLARIIIDDIAEIPIMTVLIADDGVKYH